MRVFNWPTSQKLTLFITFWSHRWLREGWKDHLKIYCIWAEMHNNVMYFWCKWHGIACRWYVTVCLQSSFGGQRVYFLSEWKLLFECIPLVIMSPYTCLITNIISNACNLRIYMWFNACTGMSINCCWKGGVFRCNDYRVPIGILCDKGPRYGSIGREYLIDYYPI